MNASNATNSWFVDTAKILGFDSSPSFALVAVLLFATLLLAAATVVYLAKLTYERAYSRRYAANVTSQDTSLLPDAAKTASDLPSYEESAAGLWWDDNSLDAGLLLHHDSPPPSFSTLDEIQMKH
jgi:hypothetical protein